MVAVSYKVWHYTQGMLHKADFAELWQVSWQPLPADNFPKRPISPIPEAAKRATDPNAKKQVYRPPGARGLPPPPSLRQEPVKAEPALSKTALKNKKKREAKKAAATVTDAEASAASAAASATPVCYAVASLDSVSFLLIFVPVC
jgi:translation initiation factor 2A